eukprot:4444054-Amphidinium_carterae.2
MEAGITERGCYQRSHRPSGAAQQSRCFGNSQPQLPETSAPRLMGLSSKSHGSQGAHRIANRFCVDLGATVWSAAA